MATQKITTRIKNKIDSLESWVASNPILLSGEIAIIKVATGSTFVNSVTGQTETVYELLMKVGNGTAPFDQLPWLSSKASDVFDWGKLEDPEDIPITILVGSTETNSTLGAWLKSINDKASTNASNISSVSAKVDVAKVSTAISTAINALDSTVSGSGNFVKAVTQTNGVVAVTKGNIAASDIPELAASKIVVTPASTGVEKVTLDDKITDIDAAIAALEGRQVGHTDAQINSLITTKIGALDVNEPSASGTSTSFIATAKQTDGKIVVTKKNLPTASTSVAGIATLGVSGGAATFDAVNALSTTVGTNTTEIAALKTAVSGGVHFIGVTTTAISDGSTTSSIAISGKSSNVTAATGDIVLYGNKEYIWTGSAWKELGDQGRIATLETKVNNLDYNNTTDSGTNKFVTNVTQTDGKIAATFARPSSSNISHGDSDLNTFVTGEAAKVTALEGKVDVAKVSTAISAAIEALDVSEPTSSGTSSSFIKTAKQENGKIVVTKAGLPSASTSTKGVVKLGATGGAATYDAVNTLSTTVGNHTTDIAALQTAITNGVHFIGIVTSPADLSASLTSGTVTVDGKNHIASKGDIVIQGVKEFIWAGTAWVELGDPARIKAVEDAIAALDLNDTAATSQFVTKVTQTNGKIAVSRAQPTATDIKYGTSSTVNAALSGHDSKISALEGKVDVTKVSTAISSAINALDGTTTGSGTIVKAVSQTDGKVTATMGSIVEAELPDIGAAKIVVTPASGNTAKETLATRLTSIDADITALEGRQVGHTDEQIATLISNQINSLDFTEPADSTATTADTIFIDSISQTNGKITATKKKLPTASTSVAGIMKLGASGGAATYAAVSSLSTTVGNHTTDIAALKSAVTGGVHFIGISTTAVTDSGTETPTIDGAAKTPTKGDVVIYNTKEYIWTGSLWKELGDQGRLATLETKVNNLDYTDPNYAAGKVVTKVTQTDGKITVSHEKLSSADVDHDDTTVDAALDDHNSRIVAVEGKLAGVTKVTTSITDAINALDVNEPSASGTSTSFIATAKQTNGKIVVTKKNLPTASTSAAGITQLGVTGGAASYDAYLGLANTVNTSLAPSVATLKSDYVRFNTADQKLYVGTTGADEIIFDCGGADI